MKRADFMPPRASLLSTLLLVFALLAARPVRAAMHTFDFTGTGVNGTTASGTFTVDDPQTAPNYVGDGTVFTAFSVTLTNIPAGSGTFTLAKPDFGASYIVDSGGTPHVRPNGNYPATGSAVYRLFDLDGDGVNTAFRSTLYYADSQANTLNVVDTITWFPAVEEVAAVPEPATYAAGGLGALTITASALRRRVTSR